METSYVTGKTASLKRFSWHYPGKIVLEHYITVIDIAAMARGITEEISGKEPVIPNKQRKHVVHSIREGEIGLQSNLLAETVRYGIGTEIPACRGKAQLFAEFDPPPEIEDLQPACMIVSRVNPGKTPRRGSCLPSKKCRYRGCGIPAWK